MQIKERIRSHKKLLESVLSLSVIDGMTVIIPLITLPYLLRVIGAANYGRYSFVYVVIQYFLLLCSYGFGFSATKQIAQNRSNYERIVIIYNAVLAAKCLLFIAGISLFAILSPILFDTFELKLMFFLGISIVVGDILTPAWFFQGMEEMRYLALVNLGSKTFFTLLIFLLVRSSSDYIYVIFYNGLGFLLAGILSTVIAVRQFKMRFMLVKWRDITFQLNDGAAVFGSTIGMNLYRNANIFLLKFFVDDVALGLYSAAEKIVKGLQILTGPISEALFPHIGHSFAGRSLQDNIRKLLQVARPFAAFLLLLSMFSFFLMPMVIQLVCGDGYDESVILARIMCPVILLGGLNYLFGIVGLVNLNYQKYFFYCVMLSGALCILFVLLTSHIIGVYAGAWSLLLSEVILLLLLIKKIAKLCIA